MKALHEAVEINFPPSNREHFKAGEPVTMRVVVKNLPSLEVKIFEVNTFGVLSSTEEEIQTNINVDGLVANVAFERDLSGAAATPFARAEVDFDLSEHIDHRGVFVVEFIGAGISSRALVRIGTLRLIEVRQPCVCVVVVVVVVVVVEKGGGGCCSRDHNPRVFDAMCSHAPSPPFPK